MIRVQHIFLSLVLLVMCEPSPAYGDFWGGDIPLLAQIVANTLQQLSRLQTIVGKGQETIDLIKDINRGIRDAMDIANTRNTTISSGVLSDLENVEAITKNLEQIYGRIPKTANAPLEKLTDTTVAESIKNHNDAFRYAEQIDSEAERIKNYAKDVNQLGAQKLTAQALGILIHVTNQLLRTNATIVKLESERLALENRSNKQSSEQYKREYESLSQMYESVKPTYRLSPLSN